MLCIRCGHPNPQASNFCEKCNAKLLQMAPTGVPGGASAMEVDEHTTYLTPERSYVTEHLYNLTCRAYEYLHLGEPGEPLAEAFEVVKTRLDEFEQQAMPEMIAQLQAERSEDPQDEYPKQLLYLVNKGASLYREGVGLLESFIQSGEDPVLVEAVGRMQDGNNNICLAYELIATRNILIEEELRRREIAARASGGQEAAAPAEVAAPAED